MNRSGRKITASSLFCALALLLLFAHPNELRAEGPKHVLLLNSYHQNMTWVGDIVRAVEDEYRGEEIVLHIENMDTKRIATEDYFQALFETYRIKYGGVRLDLILSSDNQAFDFLRRYRDTLFPGVPVSFCGVADFEEEQLEGHRDFTGVAETFSARGTVEAALALHPGTKRIFVVNDYLKTGRAWERTIRNELRGLEKVHIDYAENLPMAELKKEIASLEEGAVVLLGVYFSDLHGEYFTYEKIGAILAEASRVPVYCLLEFNVGAGVVGGKVISGYYQGRMMSSVGSRILAGEEAGSIPVLKEGANRFVFDFRQLERFGIAEEDLPPGSLVVHRPYSVYREYKTEIWTVAAFILALLATIAALILNIRRRHLAESNLRRLLDASPVPLVIYDREQNVEYLNEKFTELFGYRLEEVPTVEHWWPLVYPDEDYREEVRKKWLGVVKKAEKEGSEIEPIETVVRCSDGGSRHIEWRFSSIGARSLVLLNDLTERKRAEEEMKHLRNYLKNIVDSMPSVLIGVDSEGRVSEWNLEAEKATGISAEEARGKQLSEAFPRLGSEMEKVRQAIESKKTIRETKVPRISGEQARFSDLTVYPLVADGAIGAVIRIDDVTERVRMEEMMIQTEKMLSVGGLAAGMAHEINNPLAGILQNAQVIENRLKASLPKNRLAAEKCGTTMEAIEAYLKERQLPSMLESVADSGRRAARIVENMLNFSRKSTSRFAPHRLAELIDQTLELARSDYDLKKKYDFKLIEIVREYEENLPEVPCEGTQIQQVLLNLLKNGAQSMAGYTEAPRFTLRLRREGEMALIEVEDNGPGMDEATRKRIFEPFFTTKEVGVGTGLGLSVSYFIVSENHGGTLSAESAPGRGSIFSIRLPFERP